MSIDLRLAALLAFGLLAMSARAQNDLSTVQITTVPVAGSISMLEGRGGNIGVSAGPDGLLIVDDQFAPLADKIRAALPGGGANAVANVAALGGRPLPLGIVGDDVHGCGLLAELQERGIETAGILIRAGDVLLDPLRESIWRHSVQAAAEGVKVLPADFIERSELLGCLVLALERSGAFPG